MEFESFFNKLLKIYNVKTITDLADKLNLNRSTVAGWKNRETYAPILEHLFLNDLENLKNILGFNQTNNLQNSTNVVAQDFSNNSNAQHTQNIGNFNTIDENILKLIDIMYSSAVKNNKMDELKTDLSILLPKYM